MICQYLYRDRIGSGVTCPYCNLRSCYSFRDSNWWISRKCSKCGNQFYICVHSIVAKTFFDLISHCKDCRIKYISEQL